ncbi:MAG: PKD domain-containing protein, partial [Hymenobacter sp.]
MMLQLPSWVRRLGGLSLLLAPALSQAQCPVATVNCTPGAASAAAALTSFYQMGIYNVTLGSINNTTSGYTDGFKDYSCALSTNLTVSTPASITIRNGTKAPENVRVWIDYNNNGTFETTELVYSHDNALVHTGTFTPPATATLGTRLRLRVASDNADLSIPTACSTPQYSQDEDYGVTLVANVSSPAAAFTQDVTTTCTGCVQFTDQSGNAPTSWLWNFGDGTTSTSQNPQHCFTTPGLYQVRLMATNAAGTSTTANVATTYTTALPVAVAAGCAAPATASYCCNYGITKVVLNTISSTSADGSAGYQNFTCTQRTTLRTTQAYTLTVTTGGTSLRHDVRAWLDYNNDGVFATSERVLEALNALSPSATITPPTTAVIGQPLRLRIVADAVGNNPAACGTQVSGQTEDYTVVLSATTASREALALPALTLSPNPSPDGELLVQLSE